MNIRARSLDKYQNLDTDLERPVFELTTFLWELIFERCFPAKLFCNTYEIFLVRMRLLFATRFPLPLRSPEENGRMVNNVNDSWYCHTCLRNIRCNDDARELCPWARLEYLGLVVLRNASMEYVRLENACCVLMRLPLHGDHSMWHTKNTVAPQLFWKTAKRAFLGGLWLSGTTFAITPWVYLLLLIQEIAHILYEATWICHRTMVRVRSGVAISLVSETTLCHHFGHASTLPQ